MSSEKHSGFANNRPASVLEEVSCGQDGAGLATSVEPLPEGVPWSDKQGVQQRRSWLWHLGERWGPFLCSL